MQNGVNDGHSQISQLSHLYENHGYMLYDVTGSLRGSDESSLIQQQIQSKPCGVLFKRVPDRRSLYNLTNTTTRPY